MKGSSVVAVAFAIGLFYLIDPLSGGRFDWQTYDAFDAINDQMIALQLTNCRTNPAARLPYGTLAQLPRFNQLLQVIIYQNRTKLLHVHNSALTRAYYLAFVNQVLNTSAVFDQLPGMEYYYYTQAADLIANPYSINGSALFMDNNCTYANWEGTLPFNTTFPLFGPRAWRVDDYNQPYNWLREPTNTTILVEDYGAGANLNYTSPTYGNNPWYTDQAAGISYLPDLSGSQTTVQKFQYSVSIRWAAEPGRFRNDEYESKSFFGPPLPGQKDDYLPVLFTSPYFDCGRTNHWIVSAVAPVVDLMPRYSDWLHLRRPRFTGVVVMDTDFLQIDINQCPISPGNQAPNYFANTARCKYATTQCMPLMGWGFRRGGYQCMCKPGFRYPFWQNGPFQGLDIEQATEQEYAAGFDCLPVGWLEVWPFIAGIGTGGSTSSVVSNLRRKRAVSQEEALIDAVVDELLNSTSAQSSQPWSPSLVQTMGAALNYAASFVANFAAPQDDAEQLLSDDVVNAYVEQAQRNHSGSSLDAEKVRSLVYETKQEEPPAINVTKRRFSLRSNVTTTKKQEKAHRRYKRGLPYSGAISDIDADAYRRMKDIFNTMNTITSSNCEQFTATQLQLPGEVAYGVETMFDNQARTALRLASFLSSFLQNEDPDKVFGSFKGDKPLNEYQLFGEAIANVMGDLEILASGIFFDQNAFVYRNGTVAPYFAPWAFRPTDAQLAGLTGSTSSGDQSQSSVTATSKYLAADYTGYANLYVNEPWFRTVKQRWGSNTYGLQKLLLLPYVRTDNAGTLLKNFEHYPIYYRSPSIDDGFWSSPYYDCNMLKAWVVTFSAPFFGWNDLKTAIQFKGIVTTTVSLKKLDINQCPSAFFVPNAFANTARCDLLSTYCEPVPGRGFIAGGYKCECRQGYEYPFDDGSTWYFDGGTMEKQYELYTAGQQNYFTILKCREAGAAQLSFSLIVLLSALAVSVFNSSF